MNLNEAENMLEEIKHVQGDTTGLSTDKEDRRSAFFG